MVPSRRAKLALPKSVGQKSKSAGSCASGKGESRLNTSSQRLVQTLTLILSLSPAAAWAMPPAGAMHALLASAAVADDGGDLAQVDELLRQARRAIGEGHLQLADSCVSRAETLNPKYSLFHIGD